jgi:hypothetical protein
MYVLRTLKQVLQYICMQGENLEVRSRSPLKHPRLPSKHQQPLTMLHTMCPLPYSKTMHYSLFTSSAAMTQASIYLTSGAAHYYLYHQLPTSQRDSIVPLHPLLVALLD